MLACDNKKWNKFRKQVIRSKNRGNCTRLFGHSAVWNCSLHWWHSSICWSFTAVIGQLENRTIVRFLKCWAFTKSYNFVQNHKKLPKNWPKYFFLIQDKILLNRTTYSFHSLKSINIDSFKALWCNKVTSSQILSMKRGLRNFKQSNYFL